VSPSDGPWLVDLARDLSQPLTASSAPYRGGGDQQASKRGVIGEGEHDRIVSHAAAAASKTNAWGVRIAMGCMREKEQP